ncbi:MAG: hypothetical protein GW762_02440 [Candidatus Pacebacteria bacterium]|nr:hypothetical protein [Candidatus Paceibacterota bacterium]PIR64269.1 MAG: hypothetical protein COU64_00055 [Candidatus Pacebacteria bacterium CG10_big_fil_rev_8_21_14_0_10_40_26]PIZ78683.1 MAG: hypothetical protein COY01_03575 [Candidatus Pacebacteria bacterium CG_4_10_14_0_2_um_filter_40_20]PJA68465.1 MAG: hypothetical protein CO156_05740 [Candidatus Pacebacteria bacterium CG_4_9_14_3_um_filter_40_12]PJC41327.1 MAG: hypothetical protein CO041_05810 [Candidatus Pacebacteria bacterium CG_4_9_
MLRKKNTIANTLKGEPRSFFKRLKTFSKKFQKRLHGLHFSWSKVPGFKLWQRYGWFVSRIVVIAFFIGLNISLSKAFLSQNKIGIPIPIATLLLQYGIIPGEEVTLEQLTNPYQKEIVLEASDIIVEINKVRQEHNLPALVVNDKLATAAATLLSEVADNEYDLEVEGDYTPLADVLSGVGYKYDWVHHNALVGPLSPEAVVTAWLSDDAQSQALLTEEFTDIGLSVQVVNTSFMGKAGVIVQLLAQPQAAVPAATIQSQPVVQNKKPTRLEEFDDAEVVQALNDYRATHQVGSLNINDDLCVYAQKRVQDLLALGSLDGHAGFIADFDAEESPIGIRNYSGTTIGENLASQYCINGTTGETIFAEHPTQLIEWCFDSSQKGHREAQLSHDYKDVCVRHGNNMYVVIFGDPR